MHLILQLSEAEAEIMGQNVYFLFIHARMRPLFSIKPLVVVCLFVSCLNKSETTFFFFRKVSPVRKSWKLCLNRNIYITPLKTSLFCMLIKYKTTLLCNIMLSFFETTCLTVSATLQNFRLSLLNHKLSVSSLLQQRRGFVMRMLNFPSVPVQRNKSLWA